MGFEYEFIYANGTKYPCIKIERDEDTGVALLYQEVKKRIVMLKLNIEKCGSYDKVIEMGGEKTVKYLKRTRNLMRKFLITYQLEYLLTTVDDIREAVSVVNAFDIESLVKSASWDNIMSVADTLRNSLTDHWYERQQNVQLKTAV